MAAKLSSNNISERSKQKAIEAPRAILGIVRMTVNLFSHYCSAKHSGSVPFGRMLVLTTNGFWVPTAPSHQPRRPRRPRDLHVFVQQVKKKHARLEEGKNTQTTYI